MSSFLPLLGIVALMALGTYLTGRLIVAVANVRWLRRTTAENVVVSAFLGTTAWMLITGSCSYAGLPAPKAVYVVGGVCAALLAIVLVQRRGAWLISPWKRRVSLPLAAMFMAIALISMYTVIVGHCYETFCDSSYYVTSSEMLQTYSVGGKLEFDPGQPLIYPSDLLMSGWFHNGSLYFYSLIQAMFWPYMAYEIYPAVMCWGFMLNMAGIYVLCRWAFRLPASYVVFALALTLAAFNPLAFSHDAGFLCQIYGTFAITFSLAVTARLYARVNWHWGSAVVFALGVCSLLSSYSEMAPFLAMGCLVYVGQVFWRARQRGQVFRFAVFFAQTVCALLLIGNIEFLRTYKNMFATMNLNGVGYPHPWTPFEFWGFALGMKPRQIDMNTAIALATIGGSICFCFGLVKIARRSRQALPVAISLAIFGALALYYHYFVNDPWSGTIGHTWNQFKLCKWAFPLVVVMQMGGFYYLLKHVPRQQIVLVTLGVVGVAIFLPYRVSKMNDLAKAEAVRLGEKPLQSLRDLRKKVDESGAENLYFVQEPGSFHPRYLIPGLLHPRPFLNSWRTEHGVIGKGLDQDRFDQTSDKTFFFMAGKPLFEGPHEKLPMGFSRINPRDTFVMCFKNINGIEQYENKAFSWLADVPAQMHIWAPDEGTFTMHFNVMSGPSLNNTQQRRLCISQEGEADQNLVTEDKERVSAQVRVKKGLSVVTFQCLDKANCQIAPNDPRTLLAGIYGVTLEPAYTSEQAVPPTPTATATKGTSAPK